MAHSLSDFKTTLSGGGARPNLFQVTLTMPTTITGYSKPTDFDKELKMLCKAANLPASNIASIDVPFRGRTFKVAGDRTFDTWSITVINDTSFNLRTGMEEWMQYIGQYQDASGVTKPNDYMVTAQVDQLTRKATTQGSTGTAGLDIQKSYIFYDIFPTNISAIDLSYDSSDAIEEFTVEFQVQYWAPSTKNNTSTTP
jgi:hypothetical protein